MELHRKITHFHNQLGWNYAVIGSTVPNEHHPDICVIHVHKLMQAVQNEGEQIIHKSVHVTCQLDSL